MAQKANNRCTGRCCNLLSIAACPTSSGARGHAHENINSESGPGVKRGSDHTLRLLFHLVGCDLRILFLRNILTTFWSRKLIQV